MHPESYIVNEGMAVDVCIQLIGEIERNVTVTAFTVDDANATG